MGAKKTHEGVDKVYDAAEKWVDAALRSDGSLFTPGEAIWTSDGLRELRERFLDKPDVGGRNFYDKLREQLGGSAPEVYQLMGEVLYFHFLIVWPSAMRANTRASGIERILSESPSPVTVPEECAECFSHGIADPRPGFNTYRPYHVGFIVEFVHHWKGLPEAERRGLLSDPWSFIEVVRDLRLTSAMLINNQNTPDQQRYALLHLVFPDTFEGTVSNAHRNKIVNAQAFSEYITDSDDDADRKIWMIRQGLEKDLGRDFDFYDPDVQALWNPNLDLPPVPQNDNGVEDEAELKSLPSLHTLATDLYLPVEFLEDIEFLLDDKKQIIFQGPPGTGKTYVARKLAQYLAGSDERVSLVQFHPSYAYDDFVQGFRPTLTDDGQAGFRLREGPLMQAAERAREESTAKHFLIIDEINRGNLAKVFGELYFLLEYRDEKMQLQYQSEDDADFSLPENLYIIGTMNTADRSIALVDLALRRRFYFVEFSPGAWPIGELLRKWLKANARENMGWVADVVDKANALLNDSQAAIGPSYFMKPDLDDAYVELIWKHSVLPYVEEHLFGESDRLSDFDLAKLKADVSMTTPDGEDDAVE